MSMNNNLKLSDAIYKIYECLKQYFITGEFDVSVSDEYDLYSVDKDGKLYYGIAGWVHFVTKFNLNTIAITDDDVPSLVTNAFENTSKWDFTLVGDNCLCAVQEMIGNSVNKTFFVVNKRYDSFVVRTGKDASETGKDDFFIEALLESDCYNVYLSSGDVKYEETPSGCLRRKNKPLIFSPTDASADKIFITTEYLVAHYPFSFTYFDGIGNGFFGKLNLEDFEDLCSLSKYEKELKLEYVAGTYTYDVPAAKVYERIQKRKKLLNDTPDKVNEIVQNIIEKNEQKLLKKQKGRKNICIGLLSLVILLPLVIYFSTRQPYKIKYDEVSSISSYYGIRKNIVIKNYINHRNIEEIAENAFENSKLKSVVISEKYLYIRKNAFINSTKLQTVKLPSTVREIEDSAFENCNITEIEIPPRCYYLGKDILKGNPIKKITIGENLAKRYPDALADFVNDPNVEICYLNDVTTFQPLTYFNYNKDKKSLVINFYPFEELVIPEGVEKLETSYHFAAYSHIKKIILPSTLREMKDYLFSDCEIESITIPDGITTIPRGCFYGCKNLKEVVLPDSIEVIGNAAFYNSGISKVNIPPKVTAIPECCFDLCENLTSIELGNGISKIERYAFESSGLQSIVIPGFVTKIGDSAFARTNIEEIEIPEYVTDLGRYAFRDCEKLKTIYVSREYSDLYVENGVSLEYK